MKNFARPHLICIQQLIIRLEESQCALLDTKQESVKQWGGLTHSGKLHGLRTHLLNRYDTPLKCRAIEVLHTAISIVCVVHGYEAETPRFPSTRINHKAAFNHLKHDVPR